MKKIITLFLALLLSQFIFSQLRSIPEKKTQKGFAKIDFLSIKLPPRNGDIQPNMGYTGIHYNLLLNDWFYAGLGIYGAVTGNKGGFFTLGVNAGIKKQIYQQLYIDTGFHFGGGGGAAAPDGGGAFILPHANLGYQFKNFSINTGWSYVNFFDKGNIKGHQLNVGIEIPLGYEYADYEASEKNFSIDKFKATSWEQKTQKTSLMLHLNNLNVTSKADATTGEVLNGKTIRLAGFELASYLSKNWFGFLKVDGAYDGIRAGYMDVILGGGYHFSFNKNRTNILAKFGVGAAGGGGIDTNGGFVLYPDISIEQKILNDTYLSLNKGYLFTPDSHFSSSTFGVGLKYNIERNGTHAEGISFENGKFKGFKVIVKQDWYFNAKRLQNPTEDLHQISLQINIDLNKNIYVAGQTSFANFGNAGAYAEGLVGAGVKTTSFFNNNATLFTQVLAGAAGGGNISTGEGLIIKPSAGFEYKLSNNLSARSSIGYAKASGGELSSPFVSFGLQYHLSFLKVR